MIFFRETLVHKVIQDLVAKMESRVKLEATAQQEFQVRIERIISKKVYVKNNICFHYQEIRDPLVQQEIEDCQVINLQICFSINLYRYEF